MSRAKYILDLLNQNEKTVLEETELLDERKFDLFENNLYESAPPSTSVLSPKRDQPTIIPPRSAPLLAETYHDVVSVGDITTEINLSHQNYTEAQQSRASPQSEISGIEELSSSPIRVYSDSSVSWYPDSEEDRRFKKKRRVYIASDSDSEERNSTVFHANTANNHQTFQEINHKNSVAQNSSVTLSNYTNNVTADRQIPTEQPALTSANSQIPTEQPALASADSQIPTEQPVLASINDVALTRWKKCDPSKWKKNMAKSNKQNGLPYLGRKDQLMPAKRPKPVRCFVKCRYQCENNFSEDDRIRICEAYWKINDFNAQKHFLLQKVVPQPLKTMKVGIPSDKNRGASYAYYFNKNESKIRVCKDFFQKTLSISNGPVNEALKYRDDLGNYTGKDGRGSRVPTNKTSLESEQKVIDHINSFPRLESHYCRKKSKRQYLDSKLTIAKMYELYKDQITTANEEPCSFYVYKKIFGSKFNLSFFTPKKDLCLTCTRYDSARRPEHLKEEYDSHIERKNEAQQAKESDKQRSITDDNYLVVTADMQSTLHIPVSGVGLLYYTRKLNVQNYTIHTSKPPHEAFCITWNEINGKRGSVEIASAMNWWIQQIPPNIKEVTIYSDTCAGQNRNQYITAFLVHLIQRSDVQLEVIEQKYLESGHTHMEVDSMHSAIERQQRHSPVYSMIDWKSIMERARSKRNRNTAPPYVVKELNYTEMLDVRTLNEKFVKNTNRDNEGNKIKWLKIKCLKFERQCPGVVKFRYQHDGPYLEFNILGICQIKTTPITRKRRKQEEETDGQGTEEVLQNLKNYKIPQAYSSPLPISEAKKKDLINLCAKGIIPQELHLWYQSLPTSKDVIDRILQPDVTEEGDEEECE